MKTEYYIVFNNVKNFLIQSKRFVQNCTHNVFFLLNYDYLLSCLSLLLGIRVMVFNYRFNNISVISRRSVLLVEETRGENRLTASHWQTLVFFKVCNILETDWYKHLLGCFRILLSK